MSGTAVRRLLPCLRDVDGGPSECAISRLQAELDAQRERLDRAIRDLQGSRDVLNGLIEAAGRTHDE